MLVLFRRQAGTLASVAHCWIWRRVERQPGRCARFGNRHALHNFTYLKTYPRQILIRQNRLCFCHWQPNQRGGCCVDGLMEVREVACCAGNAE